MRRFFIGDVHGCAEELGLLLKSFKLEPEDQLFCVGDVINKGPDSLGALEIVQQNQIKCVLGNHEAHFIQLMENPEMRNSNYGQAMLERWRGREEQVYAQVIEWPYWIEFDDIILVHAGLDPRFKRPEDMAHRVLISIRHWDGEGQYLNTLDNPPWFECGSWDKGVVFGHWALRGLVDLPGFKGLDTGCVYGKHLTAWCPEENRFYQVPALQQWKAF
jgi:bis(5'-nucleosyl)-tetraphosphatase (symmetrical)